MIDRAERDAYKLFGSIPDFQSAIFFLLPDSVYAGRVTRGIAGSTSDTLVWYSEPALEALGERIDHFEKFANFEYQLGSEAAVLAYGRAVPLAEVGTAEARARRPVRPVPAPVPVPPAVDSVRLDSIHIPGGAVSDITQRVRIFPPPCAKQDVIIPRLCDTLDAYAWRYYGFVPALQGVTGASLERTTDGVVLRASTRDGDTAIFLSVRQARLLADFIGDYERKMRFYDGDGTLSAENIRRLGSPHPMSSSSNADFSPCGRADSAERCAWPCATSPTTALPESCSTPAGKPCTWGIWVRTGSPSMDRWKWSASRWR
ncbi:MAG: hypothetical protein IPP94_18750 [Ignavibacteria bacterium]|nr:hypothetical protein [Ignavibacteria bacterium]